MVSSRLKSPFSSCQGCRQEDLLELLTSIQASKKHVPPAGSQKRYLYDSKGRRNVDAPVVPCSAWGEAGRKQQEDCEAVVLPLLRSHLALCPGFSARKWCRRPWKELFSN